MPIILLFIVAFGVSFLALMTNDEGFKSFPVSILTTFVMVTGEIDYRDVFLKNETTPNQVLQRLFLVLIVVTCGIVLMNFLVGLAVDDTSKIMERSKAEERLQKVNSYTLRLLYYLLLVQKAYGYYSRVNQCKKISSAFVYSEVLRSLVGVFLVACSVFTGCEVTSPRTQFFSFGPKLPVTNVLIF
jgi:hypothetical protein